MEKDHWVTAALTNNDVVAELLIRLKQQQQTSSSQPPLSPLITWGHRKSRSRPQPSPTVTAAVSVVNGGLRKEQQLSGSPTTPLCWTSEDGYDEFSRPSDHSSGGRRSTKGAFGNERATASSYKKLRKRKSFAELKEEEDFLLKERLHLNRELESMRCTMSNQVETSQNLKRFKVDLHQNTKKGTEKMSKMVNCRVQISCVMPPEAKAHKTGFVLPDLNMAPDDEQL